MVQVSDEAQVPLIRTHDSLLRVGCYRGSGPPGPEAGKTEGIVSRLYCFQVSY